MVGRVSRMRVSSVMSVSSPSLEISGDVEVDADEHALVTGEV
jgi:hypothetical protein